MAGKRSRRGRSRRTAKSSRKQQDGGKLATPLNPSLIVREPWWAVTLVQQTSGTQQTGTGVMTWNGLRQGVFALLDLPSTALADFSCSIRIQSIHAWLQCRRTGSVAISCVGDVLNLIPKNPFLTGAGGVTGEGSYQTVTSTAGVSEPARVGFLWPKAVRELAVWCPAGQVQPAVEFSWKALQGDVTNVEILFYVHVLWRGNPSTPTSDGVEEIVESKPFRN